MHSGTLDAGEDEVASVRLHEVAHIIESRRNGGGVEHEEIVVLTPRLSTIRAWLSRQIKAGKLIDSKVYAALYFATRG